MSAKDCPSHAGLLLILERIETSIGKIETGVSNINGRVRKVEIHHEGQNKLIDQNHDDINEIKDEIKEKLDNRMSPGKAVGIWAAIVTAIIGLFTWLNPWAGK